MGWRFNPFTGELDKVGAGGGSVTTPLQDFSATVPAGATVTIFSDDYTLFSGSKIYFTSRNVLNTKYKTYDVTVTRNNSDLSDMVSRVGKFDLTVLIQLNAGNIELVVTNNESFEATIQGYRLNF
jgi:hypothetical protein